MYRFRIIDLKSWLKAENRKPLVLRGARQVGKTWLVKKFAEEHNLELIEINFEKNRSYSEFFDTNDPQQILLNLNTHFGKDFKKENSLLFLDEIQAFPIILSKLRWFAEDAPDWPVIATGSLLEFVLEKHEFSMPVGRINYMHLEPMSFLEFLFAKKKESLVNYINNFNFNISIPDIIHQQIIKEFKEYILVGGLPAAVMSWITSNSFNSLSQVHSDLLTTYRDDFAKYKGKIAVERLEEIVSSVPKMLSQKFVYSKVNPALQAATVKNALHLLELARLCHCVQGTSANGLPLGTELQKYFKEIFLDVGLCSTALGLKLHALKSAEINLINNGGIAEQVVGQLLRCITPFYLEPKLFCWARESKKANAEIDYIMQYEDKVIPIEVKAGKTGTLKSLQVFMNLKKLKIAVRINSDVPSKVESKTMQQGEEVSYLLLSIPFYLTEQIYKLLDEKLL